MGRRHQVLPMATAHALMQASDTAAAGDSGHVGL